MEKQLAKLLKEVNENYENYDRRYIIVLDILIISKKLGYPCGFRHDASEPDWPVVVVDLPMIGQVSWHMPPSNIEYDNSSVDDCKARCSQYANAFR
jgi:hypothetical protein